MNLKLYNKSNQVNSLQQDCSNIKHRTYLALFLALSLIFQIIGKNEAIAQATPSINFTWQSGNVPTIQSVEGYPNIHITGDLTFENLSDDYEIVYEFSEQKNNETPRTDFNTYHNPIPGFPVEYGENYTFGRWAVGVSNDFIRFDLNLPEDKIAVEKLEIGDVVKAIATVKLVDSNDEDTVVASEEVVITINGPQRPEIEFSWEDSPLGLIKRDTSITEYEDLKATLSEISFRSSYEYRIKSIEQKKR